MEEEKRGGGVHEKIKEEEDNGEKQWRNSSLRPEQVSQRHLPSPLSASLPFLSHVLEAQAQAGLVETADGARLPPSGEVNT